MDEKNLEPTENNEEKINTKIIDEIGKEINEIFEQDEENIFGEGKPDFKGQSYDEDINFDEPDKYEDNPDIAEDEKTVHINPHILHVFSFIVPLFLMLIAYASVEIFPFGKQQIMVIDSWHQYFPFLNELHTKLQTGRSFLYSWNTGGGTNFLILMSYYASTPIYLLSVLFPKEYLREFMMIATLLKIGAAGLFFSIYLRGIFKRCDIITLGFSTLYALCAYTVGYYWCLMWLDCLALLPLIIYGLHRFMDEGKFKTYAVALGLSTFCNYYIGFFVAEFIVCYYIVLYIVKTPKFVFNEFLIKTLKVIGLSLIGVGLSAIMILPTFLGLGHTGNANAIFPKSVSTYNSLLEIFNNLLTNTTPAIRGGLPNIACGFISLLFGIFYFINPKINTKKKLAFGGLLLFLALSFNINILNFIWHGFHFPNEIPYRQAFVFSFVLVTMAYESFINFDGVSMKQIAVVCVTLLAYLIFAEQWFHGGDKFKFYVFYVNIALLVGYLVFIALYKYKKIAYSFFTLFLLFIMLFEGGISAVRGAKTSKTSSRNDYAPEKENIQLTIKQIYEDEPEKFFRLEMNKWYSTNDPALYGFRGISQFSSEANARFNKVLETFGLAASAGSNRFLYSLGSPLFNSIFSMKYVMTRDGEVKDSLYELKYENDIVRGYEYKYWLPIAFAVRSEVTEWDAVDSNIFIRQNSFIKKASDVYSDVFRSIYPEENTNVNVNEVRAEYGVYTYKNADASKKGTIRHQYISPKDQPVIAYIKAPRGKKATIIVNGESRDCEIDRGVSVDCGYLKTGEAVNIFLEVEAGDGGSFTIFVAGFEEEIYNEAYTAFKEESLNVDTFRDTYISGTINVKDDKFLFTSIPYDEGWSVKIDGKKAEVTPFEGGLVAVPITAGEHKVEFIFFTHGLGTGIAITLISIAMLVILSFLTKTKKRTENQITDEQ